MTQPRKPPQSPRLFDLPLGSEKKRPGEAPPAKKPSVSYRQPEELSLFSDTGEEAEVEASEGSPDTLSPLRRRPPAPARSARFSARCVAGLIDVGILSAVALATALGTHWLGVELVRQDWPALLVVLLSFSFLYLVPPLAFRGRTPGMGWAGLVARTADDQPLTFRQTVLRWLGAVLTLAACGLPLLLLFTTASLSDRLSRSRTYHQE
jgi:uncharacterized RDD family membrane protein YckC